MALEEGREERVNMNGPRFNLLCRCTGCPHTLLQVTDSQVRKGSLYSILHINHFLVTEVNPLADVVDGELNDVDGIGFEGM